MAELATRYGDGRREDSGARFHVDPCGGRIFWDGHGELCTRCGASAEWENLDAAELRLEALEVMGPHED